MRGRTELSAQQKRYVTTIETSSNLLLALIRELRAQVPKLGHLGAQVRILASDLHNEVADRIELTIAPRVRVLTIQSRPR